MALKLCVGGEVHCTIGSRGWIRGEYHDATAAISSGEMCSCVSDQIALERVRMSVAVHMHGWILTRLKLPHETVSSEVDI